LLEGSRRIISNLVFQPVVKIITLNYFHSVFAILVNVLDVDVCETTNSYVRGFGIISVAGFLLVPWVGVGLYLVDIGGRCSTSVSLVSLLSWNVWL